MSRAGTAEMNKNSLKKSGNEIDSGIFLRKTALNFYNKNE